MSTNDTILLLANGMSGTKVDENNYEDFKAGLLDIMDYLARQIALDGEGASKIRQIFILMICTMFQVVKL